MSVVAFLILQHSDEIYASLFLDPRLVGEWHVDYHRSEFARGRFPTSIRFAANGTCDLEGVRPIELLATGAYAIDDDRVVFEFISDARVAESEYSYRTAGAHGLILEFEKQHAYYMRD